MRYLFLILLAVVSGACAEPSPPNYSEEIPKEFITPEVRAFLESEEGKKVYASVHEKMLAEQQRNENDPALSSYYRLLKNGDGAGAYEAIRGPAEKGHAQAQAELAYLYQSGTGVEKNIEEAIRWNTLASDQGNLGAAANLGAIYLMPAFGRQDLPRAEKVLRACAIRLRDACVTAMAYLHMLPERQDVAQAFAWASLGSDFGMAGSISQVGQLKPQLNPAELEAATKVKSALLLEIAGRPAATK